jgi:hypothetical protein
MNTSAMPLIQYPVLSIFPKTPFRGHYHESLDGSGLLSRHEADERPGSPDSIQPFLLAHPSFQILSCVLWSSRKNAVGPVLSYFVSRNFGRHVLRHSLFPFTHDATMPRCLSLLIAMYHREHT